MKISPKSSEAHYSLGNAKFNNKKIPEAIQCYKKAIELKSDHSMAMNNLANCHRELH